MVSLFFWLATGSIVGALVAQQLTRNRDMSGLFLFTVGIGVAGAVAAGFLATFFGIGELNVLTVYNQLFALGGAVASLIAFSVLTKQQQTGDGRSWGNSQ